MNKSTRQRKSLAMGFRDVDTSGDTDVCQRCLDTIAGIPFFRNVKHDSIHIIANATTNPTHVLDAGCGTGSDLLALASALPQQSHVVGLDMSMSLLSRASERTAGIGGRGSLVRGDLLQSPFRNRTFDACRIDRVLQHLHEPECAVRELARILKPGGTLVAFDNDWDTFSISLDNREIAARIGRFWRDSFASGRIGMELARIFRDCGIIEIHNEPRTLVLTDLPLAEQVFDIPHLLNRMIQAGALEPVDATAVRDELGRKAREGTFTSGYTGYLIWGKKPE
jgi:SAM-dependent methyltransferase